MIILVVILSVFLLVTLATLATFMALYFIKRKTPLQLGPHYKLPSQKVNQEVLSDIQNLINASQNMACAELLKFISTNLTAALQNVSTDDSSCSKVQSMIKELLDSLPPTFDARIKSLIQKLFNDIINGLCSNGKISTTQLKNVITDIYASTCYQEW